MENKKMTKKEFWKQFNEDVDKKSIEDLRSYTKKLNSYCQRYFHNWLKAEEEIDKLHRDIVSLEIDNKNNGRFNS